MLLPDQTYETAADPVPSLLLARRLPPDFFCANRPRRPRDKRKLLHSLPSGGEETSAGVAAPREAELRADARRRKTRSRTGHHKKNGENCFQAGEPGIVVLRPEALTRTESEEEDEADCGPPSPCGVRFVNDNVLINGKSSMPNKPNRDRIAKLKLQFDDSLTRTFEYPSETSMCEESPAPAPLAASAPLASLADNTHIASGALCSYTPSKTPPATFQLGLTRPHDEDAPSPPSPPPSPAPSPPHCWTRARSLSADLLF
ncbi:uncharacterized protein LOC114250520 [Bombyx mandarina]|uniref:Uncharacterized protein LOC114250520 n=1 Tax=Bombyx mandarina TaxID=7092 RepID=A0A6J2KH23_BOMMA|nr:uncharacterized protein LOC114250520 [Bombyx mandarina]